MSHCYALQVRQQLQAVTEHVQSKADMQPSQVRLGNVAAQLCVLCRSENLEPVAFANASYPFLSL